MTAKARHVVANVAGGWSVRSSGASRASRNFDSQSDAVSYARKLAKKEQVELYVHGQDGMIRERNSYEPDRRPNKG